MIMRYDRFLGQILHIIRVWSVLPFISERSYHTSIKINEISSTLFRFINPAIQEPNGKTNDFYIYELGESNPHLHLRSTARLYL